MLKLVVHVQTGGVASLLMYIKVVSAVNINIIFRMLNLVVHLHKGGVAGTYRLYT